MSAATGRLCHWRGKFAALIPGILAATLAGANDASAQMVACTGVAEPGYKVLLDDITPGGSESSPLMLPLRDRISANLEQLKTETGLKLKIIRCPKRRPVDPADFRRLLVQDLTARQVVLEIWGTTAVVTNAGETYHEATIGYALVPIKFYEFDATEPDGAFLVSRRAKSVSSVDQLIAIVDQAGVMAAYASLSAGTKLLRGQSYDDARKYLCKAESLMAALRPAPASADDELLKYARRLARETVLKARQDQAYAGSLKFSSYSTPPECGGRP